jgi:hypothetical protein
MKIRLLIPVALFVFSSIASAETLPQPPFFYPDSDAQDVLEKYPLGVISQYVAGIHHGKADKTLSLPNGLTGWKYVIGGMPSVKAYKKPSGEEVKVTELTKAHTTKTYILVFSNDLVVDVLYHDENRNSHITALLVQVLKNKSM